MVAFKAPLVALFLAASTLAASPDHEKRFFGAATPTTSTTSSSTSSTSTTPSSSSTLKVASTSSSSAALATGTNLPSGNVAIFQSQSMIVTTWDKMTTSTISTLSAQSCEAICASQSLCVFYNIYTSSNLFFSWFGTTNYCATYSSVHTVADCNDNGNLAGLSYSNSNGYAMSPAAVVTAAYVASSSAAATTSSTSKTSSSSSSSTSTTSSKLTSSSTSSSTISSTSSSSTISSSILPSTSSSTISSSSSVFTSSQLSSSISSTLAHLSSSSSYIAVSSSTSTSSLIPTTSSPSVLVSSTSAVVVPTAINNAAVVVSSSSFSSSSSSTGAPQTKPSSSSSTIIAAVSSTSLSSSAASASASSSASGWALLGCYTDSYTRTIRYGMPALATVEGCQAVCQAAGYTIAGLENWTECYCDHSIQSTGVLAPLTDCNLPCDQNHSEMCGGAWRLSVYQLGGVAAPAVSSSAAAVVVASSTSQKATTSQATSSPTSSATSTLTTALATTSKTFSSASATATSCNLPSWAYPAWCQTGPNVVNNLLASILDPLLVPKGFIIPLYIYPSWWTTPGAWDWVYNAAQKYSGVEFIVVINPSSGPGTGAAPNSDYEHEILRLAALPNLKMLGYVDTAYGSRAAADVASDISTYAGWASTNAGLAMDGIFFDNQAAGANYLSQYSSYATQVKSNPKFLSGLVGFAPGAVCNPGYVDIADFLVVFEDSSSNIESDLSGWYQSFISGLTSSQLSKLVFMGTSADSTTSTAISNLQGALLSKYMFFTDNAGSWGSAYQSAPSTSTLDSILAKINNPLAGLLTSLGGLI